MPISPRELKHFEKAGKLTGQALEFGVGLVDEGVRLVTVASEIERFIKKKGGEVAFPVNLSVNQQAAHYTPLHDDTLTFQAGDIVKVDVGVHINGYIGDSARTVEVTTNSNKALIDASIDALDAALRTIRGGQTTGEIGAVVEKAIKARGFTPIRNLSGHSIERFNLHAGLSIPNHKETFSDTIEIGTVVAIEPFASTGSGKVKGRTPGNIYIFKRDRDVPDQDASKLLRTIRKRHPALPFSERDVANIVPDIKASIKRLTRMGCIYAYPVLSDSGLVSQREHTVYVTADGCQVLTRP